MRRALVTLLVLGLCHGCGLDNDVGKSGEYTFIGGPEIVDTAAYPLRYLLMIEDDTAVHLAYVYLFSGGLGDAGLGLTDLRRLAERFGIFRMAFGVPLARYAAAPIASRGLPLVLRSGDQEHELLRLDDAGLAVSGANRFLRSVATGDYDVHAYFAVVKYEGALGKLRIGVKDGTLTFEPRLADGDLEVTMTDGLLNVDHAKLSNADYVRFELLQPITEIASPGDADAGAERPAAEREIEAAVQVSLFPTQQVALTAARVTDAAGQGCWSDGRPLSARLGQVARSYVSRKGGDFAVIHQRFDTVNMDAERWTTLLDEPTPAAYCGGYR
jgi:hypothetical protein